MSTVSAVYIITSIIAFAKGNIYFGPGLFLVGVGCFVGSFGIYFDERRMPRWGCSPISLIIFVAQPWHILLLSALIPKQQILIPETLIPKQQILGHKP